MRTKIQLTICLIAILCMTSIQARSQATVSFGADLMSRYIWRGLDLGGPSPSIQPGLKFSYTTKNEIHNITVGAWGAYCFSGTVNEEIDMFASYTLYNMVSLTVTDYFFPGLNTGEKNKYYVYSADSTGHVFEGAISFNGTKKVPITFMFAMNFYGNDARKMINDSTEGKIVMSKYIEVGYKHSFKLFDFNAWIGAALDKPVPEYSPVGYYQNTRAGIINIGIKAAKNIKITEHYSLPVQCQLITNPMQQKIWLVFGFTL
jgi:hypothetical protein